MDNTGNNHFKSSEKRLDVNKHQSSKTESGNENFIAHNTRSRTACRNETDSCGRTIIFHKNSVRADFSQVGQSTQHYPQLQNNAQENYQLGYFDNYAKDPLYVKPSTTNMDRTQQQNVQLTKNLTEPIALNRNQREYTAGDTKQTEKMKSFQLEERKTKFDNTRNKFEVPCSSSTVTKIPQGRGSGRGRGWNASYSYQNNKVGAVTKNHAARPETNSIPDKKPENIKQHQDVYSSDLKSTHQNIYDSHNFGHSTTELSASKQQNNEFLLSNTATNTDSSSAQPLSETNTSFECEARKNASKNQNDCADKFPANTVVQSCCIDQAENILKKSENFQGSTKDLKLLLDKIKILETNMNINKCETQDTATKIYKILETSRGNLKNDVNRIELEIRKAYADAEALCKYVKTNLSLLNCDGLIGQLESLKTRFQGLLYFRPDHSILPYAITLLTGTHINMKKKIQLLRNLEKACATCAEVFTKIQLLKDIDELVELEKENKAALKLLGYSPHYSFDDATKLKWKNVEQQLDANTRNLRQLKRKMELDNNLEKAIATCAAVYSKMHSLKNIPELVELVTENKDALQLLGYSPPYSDDASNLQWKNIKQQLEANAQNLFQLKPKMEFENKFQQCVASFEGVKRKTEDFRGSSSEVDSLLQEIDNIHRNVDILGSKLCSFISDERENKKMILASFRKSLREFRDLVEKRQHAIKDEVNPILQQANTFRGPLSDVKPLTKELIRDLDSCKNFDSMKSQSWWIKVLQPIKNLVFNKNHVTDQEIIFTAFKDLEKLLGEANELHNNIHTFNDKERTVLQVLMEDLKCVRSKCETFDTMNNTMLQEKAGEVKNRLHEAQLLLQNKLLLVDTEEDLEKLLGEANEVYNKAFNFNNKDRTVLRGLMEEVDCVRNKCKTFDTMNNTRLQEKAGEVNNKLRETQLFLEGQELLLDTEESEANYAEHNTEENDVAQLLINSATMRSLCDRNMRLLHIYRQVHSDMTSLQVEHLMKEVNENEIFFKNICENQKQSIAKAESEACDRGIFLCLHIRDMIQINPPKLNSLRNEIELIAMKAMELYCKTFSAPPEIQRSQVIWLNNQLIECQTKLDALNIAAENIIDREARKDVLSLCNTALQNLATKTELLTHRHCAAPKV